MPVPLTHEVHPGLVYEAVDEAQANVLRKSGWTDAQEKADSPAEPSTPDTPEEE